MTKDYRNEPDYFTQGFERNGVVSVWAGLSSEAENDMEIDILQEHCGVGYYRLDDQESNCFNFEPTLLRDLLNDLSYSESFIDAAIKEASNKGIAKARWIIVQYDFEYNPRRVARPISIDPIFIGAFPYVIG